MAPYLNAAEVLAGFRVFGIETSSYCNRHCPGCQREGLPETRFAEGDRSRPRQEYLDEEVVYGLLDWLGDHEYRGRVQMFNLNEPLLDPRMPDFLRYAADRGLHVRVTTNGDPFRRDPELLERIVPFLGELSIGIYDYSPSRPEWPERRNRIAEEWLAKIDRCGRHDMEVRFSVMEKFRRVRWDLRRGRSIAAPCQRVNDGAWVQFSGDVTHCCADYLGGTCIGNVHQAGIEEILVGDERRRLLEALALGERWRFDCCRDCVDSLPEMLIARDPDTPHAVARDRLAEVYGAYDYDLEEAPLGRCAADYVRAGTDARRADFTPPTRKGSVFIKNPFEPDLSRVIGGVNAPPPRRLVIWPSSIAREDKWRSRHMHLAQQCAERYKEERPRLLLVGDVRFFQGKKLSYQRLYKALGKSWAMVHDPNTLNTVQAMAKRVPEWIYANPDRFALWLSPANARCGGGSTESTDVQLAEFRTSLAYIVWKLRAYLSSQVSLLLPGDEEFVDMWRLDDSEREVFGRMLDLAVEFAAQAGADEIRVPARKAVRTVASHFQPDAGVAESAK